MIQKLLVLAFSFVLSSSFLNAESKQEKKKVIGNYELVKSAIVSNWTKHPDFKKFYPAGTLVKIQVRCLHESTKPVVQFHFKDKYIIGKLDVTELVSAHLGSHHEDLKAMKKGKLYDVDAIVVNGGLVCYSAFWLYVEKFKEIKETK